METNASEPLEPDRIITPAELLKDPREGVADARGAVRRLPRLWRGRGARNRPPSSERHNEGRRR